MSEHHFYGVPDRALLYFSISRTFLIFPSLERLPHCIGIFLKNEGLPLISLLRAQTSSNADMFFCYFSVRMFFSPLWTLVIGG